MKTISLFTFILVTAFSYAQDHKKSNLKSEEDQTLVVKTIKEQEAQLMKTQQQNKTTYKNDSKLASDMVAVSNKATSAKVNQNKTLVPITATPKKNLNKNDISQLPSNAVWDDKKSIPKN